MPASFPELTVGERCILFISNTENLSDSLELNNYATYYLSSPAEIVTINGSGCQANKIFAAYSDNAVSNKSETNIDLLDGEILDESNEVSYYANESVISTEQCEMPFADFESTLISKINERTRSE